MTSLCTLKAWNANFVTGGTTPHVLTPHYSTLCFFSSFLEYSVAGAILATGRVPLHPITGTTCSNYATLASMLFDKSTRKQLLRALGKSLGYGILTLLYRSTRCRIENEQALSTLLDGNQSVIISIWHRDLVGIGEALRHLKPHTLISQHNDGEILAHTARKWGWTTLRGSSKKGGSDAYRNMLRALRQPGTALIITPDGPRGPAQQAKPGIVRTAQRAGVPIIPATMRYSRCWTFNSWDRFRLAKPFARITLVLGEPLTIDKNLPENKAISMLATTHKQIEL